MHFEIAEMLYTYTLAQTGSKKKFYNDVYTDDISHVNISSYIFYTIKRINEMHTIIVNVFAFIK